MENLGPKDDKGQNNAGKGRRVTRFSMIWRKPEEDKEVTQEKKEHHRFSIWNQKPLNEKKVLNTKSSNVDGKNNLDKIDVFMGRNEDEQSICTNQFEDEKSQRNIFQKLGSDLFFKRPSKVFEEKKEEEEEEDESETWVYTVYRFFFPDSAPLSWLFFLACSSIAVYVNYLIDNNFSVSSAKCATVIYFMDIATYLLMMIVRLIVFRLLLPWLCPEGRIFAALSGTADPELIYCLWAGQISLLWKLQLTLNEEGTGYTIPLLNDNSMIPVLSGSIIMKSRLMVLVFAIRRLILAFIMFFFMLDFIGSMSKLLVEFLLKYRFLRLINCNWTKLRPHIVEGLRIMPNQNSRFLLSRFSSKNRSREKPMNKGDSITLPYFLTEEGISQIKKKKYQNWLAVQFVKQYSALFYLDDQFVEVKNKKDARKYAKLLFNDMVEHTNEVLLFMGKWKYKQKDKNNANSEFCEGMECMHAKEANETGSASGEHIFKALTSIDIPSSARNSSCSVSSSSENEREFISKTQGPRSIHDDKSAWDTSIKIGNPTIYESKINQPDFKSKSENKKEVKNEEEKTDEKKVSILRAEEFRTAPIQEDEKLVQPAVFSGGKQNSDLRKGKRYNSFFPTTPYGVFNYNDFCLFEEESDKPLTLNLDVLKVLYGENVEAFLKKIDPMGRKEYNEDDWVRLLVTTYETRKKMINTLESQEGIAKVFKRMVSIVLWFFSSLFILIIMGVNVNTLVISGAAVISSISVALNRLYSNFVSSVIFVVFENPYNQGDRIRINNGPIITVRKIKTFCTIFSTVESVPIMYPNYWLIDQSISNESRALQSSHIITFYMSDLTSPFVFDALTKSIKQYANDRPRDFIPNSVYVYIHSIQPGHFIETRVSFSNVNPSFEWEKLLEIRTPFYLFILHTLRQHGVEYFLPESRVLYSTWSERGKRKSNQAFKDPRSLISGKLSTNKKT
ncbi:mechanosensitive ion channel family [Cryptosporidium sp. chipmunk genotype I]|uniref:mechanosensitive ion channel family n=1 Tax=Cryptosporidium sp. chipmunk genotype I TaxID=1280935 RepID=UPI003519E52A|nr:mechanosensitive ion channel family [Cryptosporidium sp. chipmunk genotype I]